MLSIPVCRAFFLRVFLRDRRKNPGSSREDRREAMSRVPVARMGVCRPF